MNNRVVSCLHWIAAALPLALGLASPATAQTLTSTVGLDVAQEVPPPGVPSTATGTATVTVDPVTKVLSVSGSYTGLTSAQTLAHVHAGAFGVAGGVVITLAGTGGTAGTFSGSGTLSTTNFNNFLAGDLYLNIHTVSNGLGEIRGQIVNISGSTQLGTDPVMVDTGGNPIRGPEINSATEPFGVSLDCSMASSSGIYGIRIRTSTVAPPSTIPNGFLWMGGVQLFSCNGMHSQNVVSCASGIVLPNDPSLIGFTYTVQGFCGDTATPPPRLGNALIQVIE